MHECEADRKASRAASYGKILVLHLGNFLNVLAKASLCYCFYVSMLAITVDSSLFSVKSNREIVHGKNSFAERSKIFAGYKSEK